MKYFLESVDYDEETKRYTRQVYAEGAWWNVCLANFFWWLNDFAMGIAIHFENKLCRHQSVSGNTSSNKIVCNECGRTIASQKAE